MKPRTIAIDCIEFEGFSLSDVLRKAADWAEEYENSNKVVWEVVITSDEENPGNGPWYVHVYIYKEH